MTARRLLSSVFILVLAAGAARASLPDSFAGWQSRKFQTIPSTLLSRFAGDDAPVIQEYGFAYGQQREYGNDQGATLTVTLWEMKDVSGSFGLFTILRQPGMTTVAGDDPAVSAPGYWLSRRGKHVLEARGGDLDKDQALLLLAKIPALRPAENLLPAVPVFLPEKNLVPNSTKFLMGPAAFERQQISWPASSIGFDLGAEVALAQYRTGGRSARLLLISYATPQLAAKQLRKFQEAPPWRQNEDVFIRRKGSLLCVALNVPEALVANHLFDQVRYTTDVTWNQYVPHPRDNAGNLLIAAFGLAGFLLLITFFAGIFFGGFRIFAKKFLPWQIFDRPARIEIIQLHISEPQVLDITGHN